MRKSESEPGPPKSGGGVPQRRLRASARRAQILETALPVFARRGYVGTGTRDLARAAGVTEPVLYRHFRGKADLFRALVEQTEEQLARGLERLFEGRTGAPARLRALAEGLPGLLDDYRDELRVLNAASLVHEDPRILETASRALRKLGHSLSRAFRGSGLRPGVTADTAGFLLLEVGLGTALLHPLSLPEIEGEAFTRRTVRALLHGIAR